LKSILLSVFFVIAILSGCSSSTVSLSEVENVPNHVLTEIDPNLKLQLINDGEKGSYIIFHSKGETEAKFETQENKITIKINEKKDEEELQKVYLLTTDPEPDEIIVYVNGDLMPFESVTGL